MPKYSLHPWVLVLVLGTVAARADDAPVEDGIRVPRIRLAVVTEGGQAGVAGELTQFTPGAADTNAANTGEAKAVAAAITYLSGQQQDDGSWKIDADRFQDGVSSLCLLALLNGGVDARDDRVQRGLQWLRERQPAGTYDRALQTVVYCRSGAAEDAERISRNVRWLSDAQVAEGQNKGGWSYVLAPGTRADSCTRFAMWAIDTARRANATIPEEVWRSSAEYWLMSQLEDGAWAYTHSTNTGTATMTLAGISCLSMVKDAVADKGLRDRIDRAVERGWQRHAQWHDKPKPTYLRSLGFRYYTFQVLGQAAALSHRNRIGEIDWKPSATQLLLSQQEADTGRWNDSSFGGKQPLIGTSLALLFLTDR